MHILDLIEQDDGSARVVVNMDAEEVAMVLEYGLVQLLKNAVDRGDLVAPDE